MSRVRLNLSLPRGSIQVTRRSDIGGATFSARLAGSRVQAKVAVRTPKVSIVARGKSARVETPIVIRQQVNDASAIKQNYTAAVVLAAHRIVRQRSSGFVEYASAATLSHANSVVGLTLHNAVANAPIAVQRDGPISFSGWSWIAGKPIFLSNNGQMTQTPPATGYVLAVGFAITTQSMHVRIGRPVFRS